MIWRKVTTASPEETEEAGKALARAMAEDSTLPPFVAFFGDLGVGKTAFTRGFVSVLSPSSAVRSPTFALVNEYRGGKRPIFHFDMYRIKDEDDLYSIGFYDYPDRGICLTEWSENIPFALPDEYFRVLIEKTANAPDERLITIERIERSC
ncbi:MAG: tRNA (adenosine(37)-N6)-threonylcarbamoyltransferase complex ATPase subunit type 1 TsaE [Clostridia bacterium]|nr:tRNA (adenosine(37)-N6)-threonylcarbamoyltransferase complex ATPase subunit type 1 TsaE [Clostridia bacterium]